MLSGPELVELLKFANSSKDFKCFIFGSSKFSVSHCLFCMLALSNSPKLEYDVMLLHRTLHGDSVSFYVSFLDCRYLFLHILIPKEESNILAHLTFAILSMCKRDIALLVPYDLI